MSADVVDIQSGDEPEATGRATISAIGHDRPGLVSGLTSLVTELGLSIDDSRMSILGGDFAMLLSVIGTQTALDTLQTRLHGYCQVEDIEYLFRRSANRAAGTGIPYRVTVTAMDHPGIVRNVAAFFSERDINILELETDTQPAPHTGTPIFSLRLMAELPAQQNIVGFKSEFTDFCAELGLDGNLAPPGADG